MIAGTEKDRNEARNPSKLAVPPKLATGKERTPESGVAATTAPGSRAFNRANGSMSASASTRISKLPLGDRRICPAAACSSSKFGRPSRNQ